MPYEVRRYPPRKDGSQSWHIEHVQFTQGKRTRRHVRKSEYSSVGFRDTMSYEEARSWAKSLNETSISKRREDQRQRINKRLDDETRAAVRYLPGAFWEKFERDLKSKYPTSLAPHLPAVKRMIASIEMPAKDWCRNPKLLYNYFAEQQTSLSYAEKLLRVANMWGEFLFLETGSSYIPVKFPKGRDRERIADAYLDSGKRSKESAPITPDELRGAKGNLKPEQYKWLFVSLWFGLRPNEVDKLKNPASWRVERHGEYDVLAVYQSKLVTIAREKRWKFIPILFPEQREALAFIREGELQRPLVKTLRRYVNGGATTYGGRKAFQDLMMGLGRTFVECQAWLGHTSIERTWKDYRNKSKVFVEKG